MLKAELYHSYHLYHFYLFYPFRTIAIDNSVIGCKFACSQLDKFQTSEDIINLENLTCVNPFDADLNNENSNYSYIFWFDYGVVGKYVI